jgi:hypothetical protein
MTARAAAAIVPATISSILTITNNSGRSSSKNGSYYCSKYTFNNTNLNYQK